MSSRILRSGDGPVEAISWRQAGRAEHAPPDDAYATDQPAAAPEAELERLQAAVSALEERLGAAQRSGDEREIRAIEAGRQEGLAIGRAEGHAKAQSECQRAIAAVQDEAAERAAGAAGQAVDLRRRLRQQMEADLVRLAIAVARRIVRRELSVDPEALLGIVKSAVERIAARELLAIRVAPADAPRIAARLGELHLPGRVEVVADSTLAWGSVVFDTARGQQDASIETQIEEIDRGLTDLVGRPA